MARPLEHHLRGSFLRGARVAGWVALVCAGLGHGDRLWSQGLPAHLLYRGDMSPGAIGRWQLTRGGPLPGYFQPVEIRAPEGVHISPAIDGRFAPEQPAPLSVGLLIAPVYRFRVTHIPFHAGAEVFPTVEVIDRLYPPTGQEVRFPIPIDLALEDLELALDGKYVTRVIYLEDPNLALAAREPEDGPLWFNAGRGDDPLAVADLLGRPVAILRIGARQPIEGDRDQNAFMGHCPPLIRYTTHPAADPPPATRPQAEEVPPPDASAAGGTDDDATPRDESANRAATGDEAAVDNAAGDNTADENAAGDNAAGNAAAADRPGGNAAGGRAPTSDALHAETPDTRAASRRPRHLSHPMGDAARDAAFEADDALERFDASRKPPLRVDDRATTRFRSSVAPAPAAAPARAKEQP